MGKYSKATTYGVSALKPMRMLPKGLTYLKMEVLDV